MREYENFLEIGVAPGADDGTVYEITRKIRQMFKGAYMCDSVLGEDMLGWTVGINSGYLTEIYSLVKEFPGVTFVAKVLDNERLRLEYYRDDAVVERDYVLCADLPEKEMWQTRDVLPVEEY